MPLGSASDLVSARLIALLCHTWLAQTYRQQVTLDEDCAVRMLVRSAH
jgi:hypothetical protein